MKTVKAKRAQQNTNGDKTTNHNTAKTADFVMTAGV
jgi:hypothetical protein